MKQWRPSVIDESSATALRLPLLARAMHRELQSWADDCGFIAAPLSEIQAREDASGPSGAGEPCSRERAFALFVLRRHGCTRGERKAVPGIVTDLVRLGFLSLTEPGASPEGAALWSLSEHGVPCPEVATRRSAGGPQREQPRPTEGTTAEQPRNNHGTNKRVTPRNHSTSLAQSRVNDIETAVEECEREVAHARATADSLTYLSAFAAGAAGSWADTEDTDEHRSQVDGALRKLVASESEAESFGAFTADYLSRPRGKHPAVPVLSARNLCYYSADSRAWQFAKLNGAATEWRKGKPLREAVAAAREDDRNNADRYSATERAALVALAEKHWRDTQRGVAEGTLYPSKAATEQEHLAMLLKPLRPLSLSDAAAGDLSKVGAHRESERSKAAQRAEIIAAGGFKLTGAKPRRPPVVSDADRAAQAAEERARLASEAERQRAQREEREWNRQLSAYRTERVAPVAEDAASEDEREVETEYQANDDELEAPLSPVLASIPACVSFVETAAADRARHGQSTRPAWTPPDALAALEEKQTLPSAKPLTLSPPTKTRSDAQRRDAATTRPAGGRELP